jgi:hypothetical protein
MQGRFKMLLLAVVWLGAQLCASGGQVVEIRGHYVVTNDYAGGRPLPDQNVYADFVVMLGENMWKVCATNRQNAAEWEDLTYDGTNTYLLMPFKSIHWNSSKADHSLFGTPKGESSLFGIVNAGAHYSLTTIRDVYMFYPWMVYCLPPRDVSPDMPLPWESCDFDLYAYGWRWKVTPSTDGKFIGAFKIIRDVSLDLDDKDELLRPTFRYPSTIDGLNRAQRMLAGRKTVPDGFVGPVYSCKEWYKTNGLEIPVVAEFVYNTIALKSTNLLRSAKPLTLNDVTPSPAYSIMLEAGQITLKENAIKVPELVDVAYVRDYRYTRRNESRIYPFAQYEKSGNWKSGNDPELLAQRDDYLKHGPKYGDFGIFNLREKTRFGLAWLLLISIQVVAITMFVWIKVKNKNQKKQET